MGGAGIAPVVLGALRAIDYFAGERFERLRLKRAMDPLEARLIGPETPIWGTMMDSPLPNGQAFEVYLLGTTEFADLRELQLRLVYDLGETGTASLVLCEHPPTITVGRQGSRSHIRPDDDQLQRWGLDVHWVNRGGGCVLHMPGQLAVYLCIPLRTLGLSLQSYVDDLHQIAINVLGDFSLVGQTRASSPGVFVDQARVASVGVAVKRWIAYYGLYLNVATYLDAFGAILNEPDPDDRHRPLRQTSMESRRQRPAPMTRVRESLIAHVEGTFGLERRHVLTNHPMIRRKVRPHVYAPSYG